MKIKVYNINLLLIIILLFFLLNNCNKNNSNIDLIKNEFLKIEDIQIIDIMYEIDGTCWVELNIKNKGYLELRYVTNKYFNESREIYLEQINDITPFIFMYNSLNYKKTVGILSYINISSNSFVKEISNLKIKNIYDLIDNYEKLYLIIKKWTNYTKLSALNLRYKDWKDIPGDNKKTNILYNYKLGFKIIK